MDSVRNQMNSPAGAGIIGAIAGLIVGLIIGWGIWPVQWENAAPADLRIEWQEDYLRMSIDSFAQTQNAAKAQERWQLLGPTAGEALSRVEGDPGLQNPTAIENFKAVVGPPAEEPAGGTSNALLFACLVVLLLVVALAVVYFFRRPAGGPSVIRTEPTPAMQAAEATRTAERTDYQAMGEEPPLSQYMTTYMIGDDLFDDSFSVDSPAGEFLGECGVGIAETVGVGDPKRVSAFEVWLFDKNDIQTVTKVLMSAHTYNDPSTQERLAAKGEPVMADSNGQVVLETATLQLIAKVVDLAYGNGSMPENSYFERLTLELAVWSK